VEEEDFKNLRRSITFLWRCLPPCEVQESAGGEIECCGKKYKVEELTEDVL